MKITDQDRENIKKELVEILLTNKRKPLTKKQAELLASKAVETLNENNAAIMHKGVNGLATMLLDMIKMDE